MKIITTLLLILFTCHITYAQCTFDPTVTGEVILCPDSNSTLSTQEYDEYQWYRRGYSDVNPTPIEGETSQTLKVNNPDDVLYYFSVEATLDGCTEVSPEVLLDGWVFIPVTVASTGDFTVGNSGESIVCEGDTMYFTINNPYNTNITWFKDGNPIIGDTSSTLTVTEPGQYTVSGAPDICPEYVQQLGLLLEVVFIECGTSTDNDFNSLNEVYVYPNPASHEIQVENNKEDIDYLTLYNSLGTIKYTVGVNGRKQIIDVSDFEKGMYLLEVNSKTNKEIHKIIIQ